MALFSNNNNDNKVLYISYIPNDIFYASQVADYLQGIGYTVVTTPYHEAKCDALSKAIVESCDTVITITGPTATRSSRIWADIGIARLNNTPVIPFVVHPFIDAVPMRHFINAVDQLELGYERLEMALMRANGYKNNELGQRESRVKRAMKAIGTAAAVAVMAFVSAMFS